MGKHDRWNLAYNVGAKPKVWASPIVIILRFSASGGWVKLMNKKRKNTGPVGKSMTFILGVV